MRNMITRIATIEYLEMCYRSLQGNVFYAAKVEHQTDAKIFNNMEIDSIVTFNTAKDILTSNVLKESYDIYFVEGELANKSTFTMVFPSYKGEYDPKEMKII